MKFDRTKGIKIEDLDTLYIDGVAFKGISPESQLGWYETVWGANLTRSNDFQFTNIDDVDFGRVANLQITFPIMDYQTFLQLQNLLHQRHVMVDYFNVDLGKRVVEEMAITGNERKKIYNFGNDILGMRNVSIKLVGTNREFDTNEEIEITYRSNNGFDDEELRSGNRFSQYKLEEYNLFTNPSKIFLHWNTQPDDSGISYYYGQEITLWNDMVLYAIWG